VKVKIPKQKKKKVKVKKYKPGTIKPGKDVPGVFELIRVAIEMKLVEETDQDVEVNEYDPPIELRVKIKDKDIEDGGDTLKLAYCTGKGKPWQVFAEKHNFHFEPDPPSVGGEGVAVIKEWDDPAIGWGH
jgi:hypothetical protein